MVQLGFFHAPLAVHIVEVIGLGSDRLDMFFMSGSQAQAFAMAAQTMTERVRDLGPNPLKEDSTKAGFLSEALESDEHEDDDGFRGRRDFTKTKA